MAEHSARRVDDRVLEALNQLPTDTWRTLHDLQLPGRRRSVDHVLIGPPGVYVVSVEAPHQLARVRELAEATQAATAVASYCHDVASEDVRPVLCFDTDEYVDAWAHGVVVASASSVVELVVARRTLLDPARIAAVAGELATFVVPPRVVIRPAGAHRAESDRRGVTLRLVRRHGPLTTHP